MTVDKFQILSFLWTKQLSYFNRMSHELGIDYFPPIDASCDDVFCVCFFGRRLIDPVLSENSTCFFIFADAPMFSAALIPPLQKALARLLNYQDLENYFIKNPAVFASQAVSRTGSTGTTTSCSCGTSA